MTDTPTSPPGFRDGIEAAAKVAELWLCRNCGRAFHPRDNCVCDAPNWDRPLNAEEIAARIRALPLPTPDTLPTGWNSDMGEAPGPEEARASLREAWRELYAVSVCDGIPADAIEHVIRALHQIASAENRLPPPPPGE